MSKEVAIKNAIEDLKTEFKNRKNMIYRKELRENEIFESLARNIGFDEAASSWKGVVDAALEGAEV